MSNSDLMKLEELEKKYLDRYYHFLMYARDQLFEGFNSANYIRNEWQDTWKAGFDKGAERIVYSFFNTQGFGTHNSNPVASDLFFETSDAFIHIDLKTVISTNIEDGNNKHDIEQNQSSYPGPYLKRNNSSEQLEFHPNLPTVYTTTKPIKASKPCLTYFIVIIFEPDDFRVPCMYITCMPNGRLREIYGEKVLSSAKNKGNNARFYWEDCQHFELLNNFEVQPKRIKVIHYDDNDAEKNISCNICDQNGKIKRKMKKIEVLVNCKRCNGTKTKLSLKKKMKILDELYNHTEYFFDYL